MMFTLPLEKAIRTVLGDNDRVHLEMKKTILGYRDYFNDFESTRLSIERPKTQSKLAYK